MPDKNISNKPENSPQGLTVREIYDTYGRPLAERAQSLISNPVVRKELREKTIIKKLKPMKIKPLILRIRKLKISFGPFILGKILLKI